MLRGGFGGKTAWRCAQGRTRQSQGAKQLAGWLTRSSMTRCWQAAAAEADPSAVARLCAEGEEAADFIRTYVVQARLNERGNYGARPPLPASSRQAAGSQEQPLAPCAQASCTDKLLLFLYLFYVVHIMPSCLDAWLHASALATGFALYVLCTSRRPNLSPLTLGPAWCRDAGGGAPC